MAFSLRSRAFQQIVGPLYAAAALIAGAGLVRADDAVPPAPAAPASTAPLTQPVAAVHPITDDYFGTKITDPYRWLEFLKTPQVQAWVKAQAAYTSDYLAKLPGRDDLVARVNSLDNAAVRVGDVRLCGSRYFYVKLTPADQTPKLYTRDSLGGTERLLADPQALGGPGKRYAISEFSISPDGSLVAVEIAAGGSEEGVIHILDAATGKEHPDTIDRVWGASVCWSPDGSFFYYTRLQKLDVGMTQLDRELNPASYLHHLGDNADQDTPVLGIKFNPPIPMLPTDSAAVVVDPGCPYAIGIINNGVKSEATVVISPADAVAKGKPQWKKIFDADDDVTNFATHGNGMYLLSHKGASRFKLLYIDLDHPDLASADEVMPESNLVIRGVQAAKDGLYVAATQGGVSHLLRMAWSDHTKEARPTEVPLPISGSIEGLYVDVLNDGALVRMAGWTEAPQWYAFDPATKSFSNMGIEAKNPTDFSGITSVEVTAPGADGTPIPLSIIYKKDLKLDGKNPCLMEGYGAYGFSMDPNFDATRLALLEKGIVIAWAHVRGGGENGEDWHLAGQKLTKENTISDFLACAQYLEDHGYTSRTRLALRGTSAGGITIGGALTQRPDLFALALINVGVVNALRVEQEPNGAVNTPEFGSIKTLDGFKGLLAMDAYNHVKQGVAYPTVMLITGANDPRVDPVELFKMTARLQAATSSGNPVLLRVDYDAGHGVGSSKKQRDLITADQAALLLSINAKAK